MPKHKITFRDIERFTEGDCHVLARTIHRMTGWTLCSFVSEWMGSEEQDMHVFVITPSGKALDIEGTHDLDKFVATWRVNDKQDPPYREFAATEVARSWGRPAFGDYSYTRARQLAPILIEQAKCES